MPGTTPGAVHGCSCRMLEDFLFFASHLCPAGVAGLVRGPGELLWLVGSTRLSVSVSTLQTPLSLMHSAAALIVLTARTTLGLDSSLGFFHVIVFLCVSWFVAARFVSQSKYLYSLKCYY